MILPNFILPSRVNQHWKYSGIDSPNHCLDKKHFDSYPHQVHYNFNSRGFRDQEWPNSVCELQEAVWCVGDSFTLGLGSPVEHTWAYQVGQELNTRTINVSMDGASNHWIYRKVLDIINNISPRLIIIQWSYTHRSELSDTSLSDEDRRQWTGNTTCNDIELGRILVNFIQQLEITKQNTKIIHSFIPEFGINTGIEEIWNQLAGLSWPAVPKSLEEFKKLDAGIINELINFFKIYDLFDLYYHLTNNINIPEIVRLDRARDGHHYDILTAKKFAVDVSKL
jgi:hypothetical protein